MKILFSFLGLIFTLAVSGQAQVLQVSNKINQQPLAGVIVTTVNEQIILTTDTQGQVDISGIKNTETIFFKAVGFQNLNLTYKNVSQQDFKVYLVESSYALGEVVISASRFKEKKEEVPQPIQVLKQEQIGFMGQPTTADVLQQTGQVLIQKSQLGGGSPIIRGFEANKVLLVVDGVRMNNAIYRGGHLQNVITLDNALLDRAEILFGPGSVVYGSDALGGVMHFFTRNPVLATGAGKPVIKGQGYTRYATAAGEKTIHADFNYGIEKIGFLSGVTVSDFSDLRQGKRNNKFPEETGKRLFYVQRFENQDSLIRNVNFNLLRPTGYRQYDFLQKIKYQPRENIAHLLNLQYSTSSNIPRYDRLTLLRGTVPRFAEWYYGPQKRFFSSYALEKKGTGFFYDNARLITAYQFIQESRHERQFKHNFRQNRQEKVFIYSFNADFEKEAGKNEFRYGVEGNINQVHSSAYSLNLFNGHTSLLDTRYPNGGSNMQSLAGYITHAYEASPHFIIHDGLRYSQVNLQAAFKDKTFFPFPYDEVKQKNGALNGNLGFTFLPGREWRLAALGSSGFRAPNIDDLSKVFESVPGTLILPNPNLKPEFTQNTEITLAKGFKERVRVEGTAFYTWYRQAITTRPGLFEGQPFIFYQNQVSRVLTNTNAQKAILKGFSSSISADITQALAFTGNLNYTVGRFQTDSTDYPLDHIAPLFGQTSLRLKLKKFKGEFFILFNGPKKLKEYNLLGEDNFAFATPAGMPAWHTLNIRTSYQVHPQIQVQAALENIMDRNYRIFASTISAPGRNLSLTIRGNF